MIFKYLKLPISKTIVLACECTIDIVRFITLVFLCNNDDPFVCVP